MATQNLTPKSIPLNILRGLSPFAPYVFKILRGGGRGEGYPSDSLRSFGQTVLAEAAVFDVDPFHSVRWSHGTAEVVAVREVQGVSQFVHRLSEQAIGKQVEVGRQAIKLLHEAMVGNDGDGASQLCFAENESENRDVEV